MTIPKRELVSLVMNNETVIQQTLESGSVLEDIPRPGTRVEMRLNMEETTTTNR